MKINFGCGNVKKEGFVNVDGSPDCKPDVLCNFLERLPFEDGSVEYIHTHAVMEHFTERELKEKLLPEFMRILKKGGQVWVYVPDLQTIAERYLYFKQTGNTPFRRPIPKEDPNCSFDYNARDLTYWLMSHWGGPFTPHKIAFDRDYLKEVFEAVGFSTIKIVRGVEENPPYHNMWGLFERR